MNTYQKIILLNSNPQFKSSSEIETEGKKMLKKEETPEEVGSSSCKCDSEGKSFAENPITMASRLYFR